jgi:hypothetical protein
MFQGQFQSQLEIMFTSLFFTLRSWLLTIKDTVGRLRQSLFRLCDGRGMPDVSVWSLGFNEYTSSTDGYASGIVTVIDFSAIINIGAVIDIDHTAALSLQLIASMY